MTRLTIPSRAAILERRSSPRLARTTGGIAALILAGTFVGVIVMLALAAQQGYVPGSGNTPETALAFAATSPLPTVIFAAYVVVAIAIIAIALALADQTDDRSSFTMRAAVIAAGTGSAMFLAYAAVGLFGEPLLVTTFASDPAQATPAYLAMRVVQNGLNSAAIFSGGWAFLLIGIVAFRTRLVPVPLASMLLVSGLLSILSFVLPSLGQLGILAYIGWAGWLGVVLLREPARSDSPRGHESPRTPDLQTG